MMIEYVLLVQMVTAAPTPNIMDSEQVPVYSWDKPYSAPRWQRPATGIYSSSGGPATKEIEEMLEEE